MEASSPWLAWPSSPIAVALGVALLIGALYLGRSAAHGAIRTLTQALRDALAGAARGIGAAHARLAERNREVLLEAGREAAERAVAREFERVANVVAQDLSGYPALQRQMADQIARIDEDYRQSTESPPPLPQWTAAVEAIGKLAPTGDPIVARLLADIHESLLSAHKKAMQEYRKQSLERHRLLGRMLPCWRRLAQGLERAQTTIGGLSDRARAIDEQMQRYEDIVAKSDRAARRLAASSLTEFAASALVLAIAVMGGFINFHLIALPMSEMVGATSYVGPVRTSDIAALVIILTEIAMGLFLMESLRITRLFPLIHALEDRLRGRMLWASFAILLTLACVESSLAYMRDLLAADREALTQQLSGVAAPEIALRWIPSLGQMVMGFMLPFALTFAAIPLESFLHSSRIAVGSVVALFLRLLAGVLELCASFVESLGPLLSHVYDLLIVIPLRIEALVGRRSSPSDAPRPARQTGVA
jgi:hypothetical protein